MYLNFSTFLFSRGLRADVEEGRHLPDGWRPGDRPLRSPFARVRPQRERPHRITSRGGGRGQLHMPDLDLPALRAQAPSQDQG